MVKLFSFRALSLGVLVMKPWTSLTVAPSEVAASFMIAALGGFWCRRPQALHAWVVVEVARSG
ncbi:hypothetical protein SALBM311S_09610 [Streptomyces alboniger]